ncbi:hypothetical protein AKJ16_DCAP04431 [Drosera capensis]
MPSSHSQSDQGCFAFLQQVASRAGCNRRQRQRIIQQSSQHMIFQARPDEITRRVYEVHRGARESAYLKDVEVQALTKLVSDAEPCCRTLLGEDPIEDLSASARGPPNEAVWFELPPHQFSRGRSSGSCTLLPVESLKKSEEGFLGVDRGENR